MNEIGRTGLNQSFSIIPKVVMLHRSGRKLLDKCRAGLLPVFGPKIVVFDRPMIHALINGVFG